jgi:ATP-dependent Lhr-like helicase
MKRTIPETLKWAEPLVQDWFIDKFDTPTEPQEKGWPHILAGEATLIAAPTGSGKTFAAFLAAINDLIVRATAGTLKDETRVLYVSPLKALSNDIQKNLEVPLREIQARAKQAGQDLPEVRAAVRTGDTLMPERQKMLRKPPHILVTTPESLYILLTAAKSREFLRTVETVIVDEIHAVADDKRGAHLALSLERLDALTYRKAQRIGLSATQKPIEEIAGFLTGNAKRPPVIIDVGHKREIDLKVEVPGMPLGPVSSNEMWDEICDRVAQLVDQNRSTLVFVNTRKMAERFAMDLGQRIGEERVAAHHGSMSRKLRLQAENRLKAGELKALVATASLELGIDIGSVDLVCQLNSPRSIAVALQRIGRAGHWRGAVPKGRLFATTRDELVEMAALSRAIRMGNLDRLAIPEKPMDILSQQIVAACAADEWNEADLFAMVKRAYPYRNLTGDDFDRVVEMLSEGIAGRSGRHVAWLFRDQVNARLKARRGSRLAAITSGGAIPENGAFAVVAEPEGQAIGSLDEDFAVESNRGDIFLLGNTSWRIRRVEQSSSRVLVEDAHGAPPTVPFWRGEAPARTQELSAHVAELRAAVDRLLPADAPLVLSTDNTENIKEAVTWLQEECLVDQSGAEQISEYIAQGRAVLKAVPTQSTIIAERFFDEAGGMQLIIHAPFGARINKAWALALRKRFCRSFDLELQAAATDDGLNIALAERHSFPLADIFHWLHPNTVEEVLKQAVLQSPIFASRWKWDAGRSLSVLRFSGGKKVPPQIQRMRAEDLLASVFPQAAACQDNMDGDVEIPDHPLIEEVMKDALTEALDTEGFKGLLEKISRGEIKVLAVDTPVPSQFSHEILNANPYSYLDDAPLEERRARAVQMRRVLPDAVVDEIGQLDEAAIQQVMEDSWPDVRDADELADVLQNLIALPEDIPTRPDVSPSRLWLSHFLELCKTNRASAAQVDGHVFWVAAEKVSSFKNLYPQAIFKEELAEIERRPLAEDEVLVSTLRAWMGQLGPTTVSELASMLSLPFHTIDRGLLLLEGKGIVLRGQFSSGGASIHGSLRGGGASIHGGQESPSGRGESPRDQWCDRRLLSRIHRLTIATLRKQIEPVTAAQFLRWLMHWQHVAPHTQLAGERGTEEILSQLQGFEIPANAWENHILSRRLVQYDSKILDNLCMNGAVGWGRLSPHPATIEGEQQTLTTKEREADSKIRRVIPTSVAPITFFVREEADWLSSLHHDELPAPRNLNSAAQAIYEYLKSRGASFFPDIVRASGRLKSEVETALWELVTAGLVTADGFDNLRALIDPKRRSASSYGRGRARAARPRNAGGRWSLLYTDDIGDPGKSLEATCRMLLKRYGIVFRNLLTRETVIPRWRELLKGFRRLEARGEIRGGRFIHSILGEQFGLPIAVESLRAMRKAEPLVEPILLNAADPLNLIGILVPGERVPSVSSRHVIFFDGPTVRFEEVDINKLPARVVSRER